MNEKHNAHSESLSHTFWSCLLEQECSEVVPLKRKWEDIGPIPGLEDEEPCDVFELVRLSRLDFGMLACGRSWNGSTKFSNECEELIRPHDIEEEEELNMVKTTKLFKEVGGGL